MGSRSTPESFDLDAVFAAFERVDAAIDAADSSADLLSAVLDQMLDLFDCDRAWLLYPCRLDTDTWEIPMERTRPEYPGAGHLNERLPMDDYVENVFRLCLERSGPVRFDPEENPLDLSHAVFERFQIQSQLLMAIRPKDDDPWIFGIHHCREAQVYDESALMLFRAIGNRIADGLGKLIAYLRVQQSEERFRTLVEHAPEAIVIYDVDRSRYIEANRRAEELFGIDRATLIESHDPFTTSPEHQSDGRSSRPVLEDIATDALSGQSPCLEWEIRAATGERVPCELRLVRLPDPRRRLLRASLLDITARRRAEEERAELEAQLAQSQKLEAIGQLTGGVAHDFNNLLTVILGNLELLDGEPDRASFVRDQVGRIRTAAERAASLTHRLLAFARRQPLRPQVLDLRRLLSDMDELLRRSLGEAIEIELVLGGGLWNCVADATQLQNALLNLALNARDAMPSGGRLTIEAGNARLDVDYAHSHAEVKPGQYVLIAVTDNGSGIPRDRLDEIFQPFFTTKELGKGSGLGLSMVYGFVKQSGGHIKAYSEPGVGTTMKIYLPKASADAPIAETNGDPAPELQLGRYESVLVVEDDHDVRELTRVLLGQLGYRVFVAEHAKAALQALDHHPGIALLLTDVVLPGGTNGADLAREARRQRPGLRVLFMSGYTENAIIHNGRLDEGAHLLEKPFTRTTLARTIREVLADDAS